MRLGEGRDEVVVVGGDGLKGGGCDPVRPAFLLEGADGAGGVLQDPDDAVEEDAVEADGLLVALDEGVMADLRKGCGTTSIRPKSGLYRNFKALWLLPSTTFQELDSQLTGGATRSATIKSDIALYVSGSRSQSGIENCR